MSKFLTQDVAEQAVKAYLEEMRGELLARDKKGFHVTVFAPPNKDRHTPTAFYEHSENFENWGESRYRDVARAKARLCGREKMNSGDVPVHCLHPGDVRYPGGVWYKGIVVAISGFPSEIDETYSLKIAQKCEELAREAYRKWVDQNGKVAFV
jgi:hypothetical protein